MNGQTAYSSKGKDISCFEAIKEGTKNDFGDSMADSFHDMNVYISRKRKVVEEPEM
ncbi:hypothetical protein V6N11_072277, partial [Hibiscus sabdariffa]